MLESERVKVLVVGDSGVGKTALVHLICSHTPLLNPSFTVGCSLEVKVHLFRAEPSQDRPFFVELWDVGGSNAHSNTRAIFYQNLHGLILVYDCTNRKSQLHLKKWMTEVLQNTPYNSSEANNNGTSGSSLSKVSNLLSYFSSQEDVFSGVRLRNPDRDANEEVFKPVDPPSPKLPVLVVGTKLDLLDSSTRRRLLRNQDEYAGQWMANDTATLKCNSWNGSLSCSNQSTSQLRGDSVVVHLNSSSASRHLGPDKNVAFAAEHGFPEILLCCNSPADMAPNSWNASLLDKFFDDVIRTKLVGLTTGSSCSPDGLKTRRAQIPTITEPVVPSGGTLLSTDSARTARLSWFT